MMWHLAVGLGVAVGASVVAHFFNKKQTKKELGRTEPIENEIIFIHATILIESNQSKALIDKEKHRLVSIKACF
ncbi:hypothetical protein [Shewanella algae]|uniref:hypothetical protein n=1 Tax=Shewanella algae TaxID=38313 RepID=UPI001BED5181|nr:hypothetical protein [Shewanella algae]BCV53267.1 hypothetical protein TUM17383_15140 [Shewanella algae]